MGAVFAPLPAVLRRAAALVCGALALAVSGGLVHTPLAAALASPKIYWAW